MHIAWVQEREDRAVRSLEQVAKDGFYLLGYEVRGFTKEQWDAGEVELNEDTIVAGYIGTVLGALDRLGVERPQNIDYPDALKPWLFRHIERTTVGEFLKFWSSCRRCSARTHRRSRPTRSANARQRRRCCGHQR
jgi:hypothetical protein